MLSENIPVQQQPGAAAAAAVHHHQSTYDKPRVFSGDQSAAGGYGIPRDTVNPEVLNRPSRPTTTCPSGGSVATSPSPPSGGVRPMPSHQPLLTRQSTSTPVQTPTIILHGPPEEHNEEEPRTFEHFKFKPNGGGAKVIHEGTEVEIGDDEDTCMLRNRCRLFTFGALFFIVAGAIVIYLLLSEFM